LTYESFHPPARFSEEQEAELDLVYDDWSNDQEAVITEEEEIIQNE
jgi:hypothetical protein